MATSEEIEQPSLDDNKHPLLIIYEGEDEGQHKEQREVVNDQLSTRPRHHQRGRGRANRASSARLSSAQRGRVRGLRRETSELHGFDNSETGTSNFQERGRGRARDRRPYRSRAAGSRYQSSDRRLEEVDMRDVDEGESHRRRDHAKSRANCGNSENIDGDNRRVAKGDRMQTLSEAKLIDLSKWKEEPDTLLLEIDKVSAGFLTILKKPLEPNSVYYVVRILSIISRSTQRAHLRNILREVESNMLGNLTGLLFDLSMKDQKLENIWNVQNNLERFLLNIIAVLKVVLTVISPSLGKCKSLINAIRNVTETLSIDSTESELESIETLFEKVKCNKEMIEKRPKQGRQKTEERIEPPNYFREIPIFPELGDLHMDEKPFLRANKVKGKYEDLDTYLDVQFRLLREDYLQPLRKGISEYRDCIMSGGNVRKIKELKLYNSVRIMYPVCSGKGINHVIQFDTSDLKNVRWASSRRLLHGSLLCLSSDSFDTILYATVTGRDDVQLKEGKLEVHFEKSGDVFESQRNNVFIMAETLAYFEAYRFILEGLQEIEGTMPFEKYLVRCETTVKPPRYLLIPGGPCYNFSKLLIADSDAALFPVLNTRQWPKAVDLGLDSSQYEALQRAITKELAIIQGPPGTGKTYVGLKIAQLLLDNQTFWKMKNESAEVSTDKRKVRNEGPPILVVCFTNHALDQFLEGLLSIGRTKIVRIGGRCKNETIEPFVLRNVKRQRKENGDWNFRLSENDAQCKRQLKECEEAILLFNNQMTKLETKIVSYRTLQPFMTEAQQDAFESSHTEKELKSCFSNWLGVYNSQQSNVDLLPHEQIKQIWVEFIVKEVTPMTDRRDLDDIFSLQPLQRAELYKAWVKELVTSVHILLEKDHPEDIHPVSRHNLEALLHQTKRSILEADILIEFTSRSDTRRQLMQLKRNEKVNNNPIFHWLCLSQKTSDLKEVLDENIYNSSNTADISDAVDTEDIEEERELDEEDEDFIPPRIETKQKKKPVEKNDGEWIRTYDEKSFAKKIRQILKEAKPYTSQEAEKLTHVWDLSDQARKKLYTFWIESYRKVLKENVKKYEIEFNEATDKLQEVRNMETIEILKDSEIVGMTTTGAAKYRTILQSLRPKIIIVEEAAEVLESHIVTTLNESCQHLILIGDHKQLRPSTTVYALAKKYHMDISLFERMVCNNVPCVTLEEQHRMRPEISVLLTHESLYPNLRNHRSVLSYEDIKGIDKNFQFINHNEEEVSMADSTSYTNPHEAKYLAKLCRYLLNQGYKRDQISVITPYMGQVLLLRKEMPKSDFDGVRITAVDNFQGEENDIILLSLVRSRLVENMPKNRNPIGFVGIENRICVSLSRAKKGFFVIGNFSLLEQFSEMWERMIRMMREKESVDSGLKLICQNHPEMVTFVQTAADFKNVPEGGCSRSCNAELSCGHLCPKSCHPVDRDHESFLCNHPCERIICIYRHKCTKLCHETCGQCNTYVEKTIPMCDHKAKMPCHIDPYKWKCKKNCKFALSCGHPCSRQCSECTQEGHHENECKVEVTRTLECGHEESMKCHEDPSTVECKVSCETFLDCKHKCSGTCGLCFRGRIHKGCDGSCGKILICGHKCSFPCSEICPPCTRRCEFSCSHGKACKQNCYQDCTPCHDPCRFNCNKHKIKCTLDCNEPCEINPCSQPCNKILKCKESHGKCRGICGEKCFCIICQKDKVRLDPGETLRDNMVFIQLPNCYCILEIGKFSRFINTEQKDDRKGFYKRCPHCEVAVTKHIRPFTNVLKATREQVVQEYAMVTGTLDERKDKVTKLKREFSQLKTKGLTAKDVESVTQKLQVFNFGALLYAQEMKGRLKRLLDICDFMENSCTTVNFAVNNAKGIIKPIKLRDLLLRGKRFVSKQFWQDVDKELNRIHLWVKFYVVNDRLESVGKATPVISDIISGAFQIISKKVFKQEDEKILTTVYKSMISAVKETRSTELECIKDKLDDFLKKSKDLGEELLQEDEMELLETRKGTPA